MRRLIIALAIVVGAVAGLYVSVQIQWALVNAGVFGTQECRDVIIQPSLPSPSCIGPGPTHLPTIAGAFLGGLLAFWMVRRVVTRKDQIARR